MIQKLDAHRVYLSVASFVLALCAAEAAEMAMATSASAATGTWTQVQTFVKSGPVRSPSFISASRGWALIGNRLLQTNDGGQRWSVSVPDEWNAVVPTAVTLADPLHAWVVGDGFIMATSDGGAHWTTQPAEHGNWVAVHAVDASHVYATSADGTLLGTADGGASWRVCAGIPGGSLPAIAFADASHGWAAGQNAAGHGLLLASSDGGTTWAEQPSPADAGLSAIAFADPLHGWAAETDGGLLRTTDGGGTWTRTASPLPSVRANDGAAAPSVTLAFLSATHGFAGAWGAGGGAAGGACLWETLDGGASWHAVALPGAPTGVAAIAALDASHALALGTSLPSGETLAAGSVWGFSAGAASSASSYIAARTSTARLRWLTAAQVRPAAARHPARRAARHHRHAHIRR